MLSEIKNSPKSLRNSNVEVLRFFLMLFICFWHIIMHGYNFKDIGSSGFENDMNMGAITFFCTLFSPAVYCFMFISGWYGIRFSMKKYAYFVFMAISCYLLGLFIRYVLGDTITPFGALKNILPISTYYWWFLTYYIMVYLLAPFIDVGFKFINKITIKQILCIMTFIEIASFITLNRNSGSNLYGLLYIYILARFLKTLDFKCSSVKLIVSYAISFFCLWALCYKASLLSGENAQLSFRLLGYNNPLIIIMAVSIFFLFLNLKPFYSKWINKLCINVLSIYLLTEAIGDTLYKYEVLLIERNFLYGILFSILVMILCLLTGEIIHNMFNYISKQKQKILIDTSC